MSKLLVRPDRGARDGRVIHVTPENAGWTHVGFDLLKLGQGASASGGEPGREACLVFVAGRGSVTVDGTKLGSLGERTSPFVGKPHAVYVPAGAAWTVTAETPLDLAVCSAPAKGGKDRAAKVIRPDDLGVEIRGKDTNQRFVTDILPESDPAAESLLVVEVITPSGHWSSYPPHKHDRDALPSESQLEETYYHRIKPASGFAFQRIYTDDRSLDEAITVEDGDLTLVPRGYHPCAAAHGYDLYYLNVMAGPRRTWKVHNDPAHEWMLK